MFRRSRLALLFVTAFLTHCSPKETAVRLTLQYEESWQLSSFELAAEGRSTAFPARTEAGSFTRELYVTVRDELLDRPVLMTLRGFRGEGSSRELFATGSVTLTPLRGQIVQATLTLARTACATWCTPGAVTCRSNGVAVCIERPGECPVWGASTPCSEGQTCSLGVCNAACVDECAEGEARCAGPLQVELCGQNDDDSCLEWLTPVLCGGEEVCSNGQCSSTCVSECVAGEQRCRDGGISVCGDVDRNGCMEWGPAMSCSSGQSCQSVGPASVRCLANDSCADECTSTSCVGATSVAFARCGNYDLDPCQEPSSGTICTSPNPCQVGRCDAASGCALEARSCPLPEPTCVNDTTLRIASAMQCNAMLKAEPAKQ